VILVLLSSQVCRITIVVTYVQLFFINLYAMSVSTQNNKLLYASGIFRKTYLLLQDKNHPGAGKAHINTHIDIPWNRMCVVQFCTA
jgi:hypothetical protein